MTETQLTNPIKKFSQQSNTDGTTYVGKFGADADNVQITLTNEQTNETIQTSLLNFFKNWQDFKKTNAFMYHGDISIENMNNLDQQVKFLYRFGTNGTVYCLCQFQDPATNTSSDELSYSCSFSAAEIRAEGLNPTVLADIRTFVAQKYMNKIKVIAYSDIENEDFIQGMVKIRDNATQGTWPQDEPVNFIFLIKNIRAAGFNYLSLDDMKTYVRNTYNGHIELLDIVLTEHNLGE